MSLQWTLIATFLYVEIGLVLLMILPIIKPRFWRKLFNSRFMRSLAAQSNLYLTAFLIILLLFFVESIREFRKYGDKLNRANPVYSNPASFYEDEMRLFRGQRNFYISGFALFSLFIIKRLASLISQQGFLELENQAITTQARNVSHQPTPSAPLQDDGDSHEVDKLTEQVNKLEREISDREKQVAQLKASNVALKKQTDSCNREFECLSEQYKRLQDDKDAVTESSKDK